MSTDPITDADLDAYLDEALPVERMTAVEAALRARPELARQLAAINARRDAGVHSLAAIWRHYRVTCPSREGLGSYLLGALNDEMADYVRFHLDTVGCRYCRASVADLESQQAESGAGIETRRRRYFQSSAGYLGK
jgi:anti-sigma factor RsiW